MADASTKTRGTGALSNSGGPSAPSPRPHGRPPPPRGGRAPRRNAAAKAARRHAPARRSRPVPEHATKRPVSQHPPDDDAAPRAPCRGLARARELGRCPPPPPPPPRPPPPPPSPPHPLLALLAPWATRAPPSRDEHEEERLHKRGTYCDCPARAPHSPTSSSPPTSQGGLTGGTPRRTPDAKPRRGTDDVGQAPASAVGRAQTPGEYHPTPHTHVPHTQLHAPSPQPAIPSTRTRSGERAEHRGLPPRGLFLIDRGRGRGRTHKTRASAYLEHPCDPTTRHTCLF